MQLQADNIAEFEYEFEEGQPQLQHTTETIPNQEEVKVGQTMHGQKEATLRSSPPLTSSRSQRSHRLSLVEDSTGRTGADMRELQK